MWQKDAENRGRTGGGGILRLRAGNGKIYRALSISLSDKNSDLSPRAPGAVLKKPHSGKIEILGTVPVEFRVCLLVGKGTGTLVFGPATNSVGQGQNSGVGWPLVPFPSLSSDLLFGFDI